MANDLQTAETAAAAPGVEGSTVAPPALVAADPHERFLRVKNFASLNGVRALCCLAVVKVHIEWDTAGPHLLNQGFLGVDLFFVISGFLIVTLLIRERKKRGDISLKNFYARRALRIFPIYYLLIFAFLLFYVAVSPWRPNGLRFYGWTFLILLTYTQDLIPAQLGLFFHCWSLAMEEQFYQFWPTIEKFAAVPVRWAVLIAMLAVNQAVNFGAFNWLILRVYGDPAALKMPIFVATFTPILMGVMLAYLLDGRGTFRAIHRLVGYRWSPFLILAALLALWEFEPSMGPGWPKLSSSLVFTLLLASLVVREDHYARPILTFAPLARLGVVSYGIYLYHVLVIVLVEGAARWLHLGPLGKPTLFVAATLVTVAVAEASFRLIEQPLLRLKERFHS